MSDQQHAPAKVLPNPETHPLIFRLARQLGKPISFYDIETTGLGHKKPTFGITEFAFLAVLPDGKAHAHAKLLNPENTIEPEASAATGITQDMVEGQPHFGSHSDKVLRMMERSVMVGFNCNSFDTPAMIGQLDRYGVARPAEWHSVDAREMWTTAQNTKKGKLVEVAEHYGVPFTGAHRAYADCSALADILEQMIWRHGTDLFIKAMRKNWDGPQASDIATQPSRAKNGELTPTQTLMKTTIDTALARGISVAEFVEAIGTAGFAVEVTRYGGSRYFYGRGSAQEEKLSGSDLGKGYSWKDVSSRLSGDTPDSIKESGASTQGAPSERKAPSDRVGDDRKAVDAVLAAAESGGRIDIERILAESGAGPNAVSFAVSNLLTEGKVKPEQVSNDVAQSWLNEHWMSLPTDGKLTPLLDACKKNGAPEEVDFLQLRVAKAARGSAPPPSRPPAPRPVYAQRPAPAQAPSALSPTFDDIPPFDDVPPFDDIPSASRHAP